jgi:hypothetical protein
MLDNPTHLDFNSKMRRTRLTTFDGVVGAIGGMSALARLTGRRLTAVSNWRHKRGLFPAETYFVITAELARRGFSVERNLWGFEEAENVGDGPSPAA